MTPQQSVADAVLRFCQGRARGLEIGLLGFVKVLRKSLRLVAACGRDRVTDVAREPILLRRRRALGSVLDDQLPQLIRELPANQIFVPSCHARPMAESVPAALITKSQTIWLAVQECPATYAVSASRGGPA